MGPKSKNTMSSAVISRSGGLCLYGCRVFGPARTIRLCQCRLTPNISAARSRIASLASISRTPGAMMPRGSMAANSSAALACASSSRAERTPSSSTRPCLANGQRLVRAAEVTLGHDEDLALCESHVSDHTHAHAGGPCTGRLSDYTESPRVRVDLGTPEVRGPATLTGAASAGQTGRDV